VRKSASGRLGKGSLHYDVNSDGKETEIYPWDTNGQYSEWTMWEKPEYHRAMFGMLWL
jgi:hypothetical protein